jgi:extracellular elastinolytic metalloproteinase
VSRELDRRDFGENKVTADREAELRSVASAVSDRLPGEQQITITSFDATTGNPEEVRLENAPVEEGNYVQRALDYVQGISRALGIEATQPAEFATDPQVQQTTSGAVAVHLQQLYKGIPVFEAAQAVRFAPSGAIQDSAGSSVTVTEDVDVSPRLSAEEAVLRAAQHVAEPQPDEQGAVDQFGEPLSLTSVDLSGFEPRVTATFPTSAARPTVLEAGPFEEEIRANLLWFPIDNDLRLAWDTLITMPNYEGQYRTIVAADAEDADTGEILYCRQILNTVAARGNVYLVDGADARRTVDFPRPLEDYGLPIPPLPPGFPEDWVDVDRTVGNNTNAHQGNTGPSVQGQVQNGVATFNPANDTGVDQQVLNIFYYNCYMHDYFYLLLFRERDGNFQQNNLGRGGLGSDRVDARAHPGPVFGTANMGTPVEGQSPVMNMGLVSRTNRHTAFDSTVVFHEFMHGVTNRLVGGPQNVDALDAPQSGGMGEGWGDYIACVINNTTVVGAWVVNDPSGIRDFPYDSNFPDNFGDLGTGRYTEEHNIGEVWCATLMEMTRNIDKNLAVRLVVDALKIALSNPSFLNMRDSILRALDNMRLSGTISTNEHTSARQSIWRAFAKFGMGPGAQSNGAQLTGIKADFDMPPDVGT